MSRLLVAILFTSATSSVVFSSTQLTGPVIFNQYEIEGKVLRVDLGDVMTVFHHVYRQMPPDVFVYPTENQYYFSFFANGRKYSGNFRLPPGRRDEGIIHFSYFDTTNPKWERYQALGENEGIVVEKISDLSYAVRYGEREVIFRLNPIGQDSPGAPTVLTEETLIGRSFDESGIIFLLVYNHPANIFLWILDPNQMMEIELNRISHTMHVHVQSGFVFFLSSSVSRYVLVGVNRGNAVRNNFFDGPFDQLPDNWLHDTPFQTLVEQAIPSTKGRINARGEFRDGQRRVALQPYVHYDSLGNLVMREGLCMQEARPLSPAFTRCLFRP